MVKEIINIHAANEEDKKAAFTEKPEAGLLAIPKQDEDSSNSDTDSDEDLAVSKKQSQSLNNLDAKKVATKLAKFSAKLVEDKKPSSHDDDCDNSSCDEELIARQVPSC